MKHRFFCLLLCLAVLMSAGTALAGGSHCAVQVVVHTAEQEFPLDMDIYIGDGRTLITSSLVPDACIELSGIGQEQMDTIAECRRILTDEKTAGIIRNCAEEWFEYMQPEIRTGVFSGDAFESAFSMRHITFSYADLVLLIRRIRQEMEAQGPSGKLTGSGWDSLYTPSRNIRFDLKLFDNGKYASLAVADGENTVMTVSLNMKNPDRTILVVGWSAGEKNYYSCIEAEKKDDSQTEITEKLYADDRKVGYPTLGENNLILTRMTTIMRTGENEKAESIRLYSRMIPANGLTPIILQGEIRNGDSGQVFDGFLRFDKIEQPQIAVTASMDDAEIGEMPARVVDLEKADSTEVAELGQEIGTELYPVLLQIVASLPKDYMQPVIQMMMQTD